MSDLDLHDEPLEDDDENLEVSLDEGADFDGDDDDTDDTYEDFYGDDDDEYESSHSDDLDDEDLDDYDDEDEEDEDEDDEDDLDEEEIDVESEVAPLDADELPARGRRETQAVELIADDEFTCTECFLVKKPSQLADPDNNICADCI